MKGQAILVAAALFVVPAVYANDPCDNCEPGEIPGPGMVTITYTKRIYKSGPNCDGPDLCSRIELEGSVETDGLSTYHAVDVVLEGFRYTFAGDCCFEAPETTTELHGIGTGYFNDTDSQATADLGWGPEGQGFTDGVLIGPGGASCTTYTDTINTFSGEGTQIIETIQIKFTGGECVEDPDGGGGGGGGEEPTTDDDGDDHDDDNNNNEPVDPDPPIPPDRPDDPDDPDPPEPPEPPTEDECCIAITTRLDILAQYMETDYQLSINRNELLYDIRVDANRIYDGLLANDDAVLPYMNRMLHNLRTGQLAGNSDIEDIEALTDELKFLKINSNELQSATFEKDVFRNIYLQQILVILQELQTPDDDGEPGSGPGEPVFDQAEIIELEQPTTIFTRSRNNFQQRLIANGATLTFFDEMPDSDPEQPTHEFTTPGATIGGTNYGAFRLTFNYEQYAAVRGMVYLFVILLESMNAAAILMEETRKY